MKCYRRPHTTPERREGCKREFLEIDEYRVKIRPKRNRSNLSNSWDDLNRSDYEDRSWKKHRKTQWKPKDE